MEGNFLDTVTSITIEDNNATVNVFMKADCQNEYRFTIPMTYHNRYVWKLTYDPDEDFSFEKDIVEYYGSDRTISDMNLNLMGWICPNLETLTIDTVREIKPLIPAYFQRLKHLRVEWLNKSIADWAQRLPYLITIFSRGLTEAISLPPSIRLNSRFDDMENDLEAVMDTMASVSLTSSSDAMTM